MRRISCVLLPLLLLFTLTGCRTPQVQPVDSHGLVIVTAASSEATATAASTEFISQSSPSETAAPTPAPETIAATAASEQPCLQVREDGVYDSRDEVALYIHLFGHLPSNYITKKQAEAQGWSGGSLEPYAPGKCIGGGRFGNYEGLLPAAKGRSWTECDIDTLGTKSRGAKRIVFSNDGLIYYTGDHYEHFELLYGQED